MKKKLIFLAVVLFLLIVPNIVSSARVDAGIVEKLNDEQEVSVIVILKDKPSALKGLSSLNEADKNQILEHKKTMIEEQQDKVLSKLNLKGKTGNLIKLNAEGYTSISSSDVDFTLRHKYSTVNGFSGMVTEQGLEKLMDNPDVKKVYLNSVKHILLDVSVPQINGDDVWKLKLNNTNITGKDETICVIDTGIDTDHSAFSGRILDQYCYCNITDYGLGGCCPNNETEDTSAEDDEGHGTHCAGIAAGNHSTYKGVAPEAGIISIKVCNSAGFCDDGDVIAGIDWCVNNASTYNISVISMSLGGDVSYSNYCNNDAFAPAINSAVGQDISVVIASGNDGWTNSISSPACVQNATPVGSVDDGSLGTTADDISSFTNRGNILNLLAPGCWITAPYNDGGVDTWSGTSMSTPHVAGAAALLKQFVRLYNGTDITPQEIENVLNDTGKEIDDISGSERNYSRIDIYAAIRSLDTTAPELNFVSPTPENNTNTSNTSIFINVTTNEILSSILLDWNGTNETMNGSGLNFYLNKTITGSGNFTYKVYGNDSVNNIGVSETRIITINNTAPTQPSLTNPANESIQTTINITINWSTSTDANGDPINYFIHFLNSLPPTYNSSTQDLYKAFTNLIDDETYYWYIIANDGTENSTASETRQFTINTSLLLLSFVDPTPTDGERLTDNYIYVNVTVIHSSLNISNCTLLWNNGTNTNISMEKVGNGTSVFCRINMTTIDGINYTYSVIANTTEGVEGTTGNRTNLENTEPQLTISYPDNNSNITTTSIYLNWSSSDADSDSITHYVYGNSTRNTTLLSLYNGIDLNYSWQINDGTYYWYVVADDSYETNTSSEYNFNVNISPILSGLSLSSASGYSDTNITVYANCSDTGSNVSSVTVSVYYPNGTWVNYSMNPLNETPRYTKSYRPNVVGVYNFSFYCQDYYGNIASNETTGLQFTSSTRPSSSGGGGGSPSVSYEQKTIGILAAGSTKAITFTKSATLAVTEITVTVMNGVTNAKIKVDVGSLPSGASAPSSAKGSVYKYITITKTAMTDSDVTKGIIKFKVKRSWLTEKGYGKDTVALNRYYSNKWSKLTTTRYSEDSTYYYYSAESPGFSTFAIIAEKAPAVTAPTAEEEEEVPEEVEEAPEEAELMEEEVPEEEEEVPEETLEEEKEIALNKILIVTLIAVVIILVVVGYFVQKKETKEQKKYKKKKKKKHKGKGG